MNKDDHSVTNVSCHYAQKEFNNSSKNNNNNKPRLGIQLYRAAAQVHPSPEVLPGGRNFFIGKLPYHQLQYQQNLHPSICSLNCVSLEPQIKQIKILTNNSQPGSCVSESINHSPKEHLLEHIWTFWYLRLEKNFSWEHSQQEISDCHSVEMFWRIFDMLVPLTETRHGCNYSLFKKGIRPIWEDPMNRNGGRFVFTITKENRAYKKFAENMWLEFSMAVVGNILSDVSDHICGIISGNRNNVIKISVWTRDAKKLDKIKRIGKLCPFHYS